LNRNHPATGQSQQVSVVGPYITRAEHRTVQVAGLYSRYSLSGVRGSIHDTEEEEEKKEEEREEINHLHMVLDVT
jgi:hypothetical protein